MKKTILYYLVLLIVFNACMKRKPRLQDLTMKEFIILEDLHPDSLKKINPFTVRRINFWEENLDTIPETIGNFIAANELHLQNNNLTEVPECIRKIRHLRTLNLADNPIKKLPSWLAELSELKVINLYGGDFEKFPEVLLRMDSLESLSIGGNPFKTLPDEVCNLTQLKTFYLPASQVEKLPENFGNLNNLERISFQASKKILELPASFSKLNKLKYLDLGHMEFTELPEEVCALTSLEQLSLSREYLMEDATPLKTLPPCIGNLVNLRDLFATDCAMESLPKEIGKLKSLEFLQVEQNYLHKMHKEWINLPDNMVFGWQGNPWSVIPEELEDVKWEQGLPRKRYQ